MGILISELMRLKILLFFRVEKLFLLVVIRFIKEDFIKVVLVEVKGWIDCFKILWKFLIVIFLIVGGWIFRRIDKWVGDIFSDRVVLVYVFFIIGNIISDYCDGRVKLNL